MAELRTEEEQIQAIKDWWKRNGSSLLIGIGAALAIVFGWQGWQNHQAQQRAEAAKEFANLLNAASAGDDQETVSFVAQTLRNDYTDSAYAIYGNLVLARQQMMVSDDPEAAIESLDWALSQASDYPALTNVIRNRLARAQLAAGNHDAALATVDQAGASDAFGPIFSELRGDIQLAKGDRDAARQAYLQAREQGGQNSSILELKLSDLGVGGDA
ncbi:Putative negative regulator of RcsB-dependent stress response [Marinobacter persicus]|uniref:Ancillary SecYEG translocon subunit n=1 Tax=Marinobacter persicus TaxID=930118 RepID=A0A1I3WUR4_9GAMM|nr:tetratricopeptide repeat protein [Marinobacter persicus]GHD47726.1 UPF0070 protein [Marinobacter persicus]SFK11258.1 Putative negative regulator of RcsB-dependent stress response [Marinobacter persicus]